MLERKSEGLGGGLAERQKEEQRPGRDRQLLTRILFKPDNLSVCVCVCMYVCVCVCVFKEH